jgi:hypothetical protein
MHWIAIALALLGMSLIALATRRVWRGVVVAPTRTPADRSLRQNAEVAADYDRGRPRIGKAVITRRRNYRRPDPEDVES